MMNEFKRMQQLAGLLTEVRIIGNNLTLPRDLEKITQKLYEEGHFMFESGSPEDHEPITDGTNVTATYEHGEISKEEFDTVEKYIGKQFISNMFSYENDTYSPNKPQNTFGALIKIYTHRDDCHILVMVPNVDMDGVQTGWFNARGEYISIYDNEDINEVRIIGHQQLFRRIDYHSYEFDAPNGQVLEGYSTDDSNGYFVEIIGNNPLLFGTVIFSEEEAYPENEEAIKQMEAYLDKHRVLYTFNQVNMEGDDEYYLCVDLDELEKKKLIKNE